MLYVLANMLDVPWLIMPVASQEDQSRVHPVNLVYCMVASAPHFHFNEQGNGHHMCGYKGIGFGCGYAGYAHGDGTSNYTAPVGERPYESIG